MDPSSFETMPEEQLQTRESADVTNAAHILGKTLGVPLDGVPSFMQRPDIPGFPKQEGIPPDHDCTICAATAACGFFSEAQKNGGNNPLMRRLQAVQELTKSSPDLMKGPDAESLIRERMEALKIQAEVVITAPSEVSPLKTDTVKPDATPKPEPVQVVKEVTTNPTEILKETPPVRPETTPAQVSAQPDLRTTVTQFEAKAQSIPAVEKPDSGQPASSTNTPKETETVAPEETPTQRPSQSEPTAQSTDSVDMRRAPARQVEQPKEGTEKAKPTKSQKSAKTEPSLSMQYESPAQPNKQKTERPSGQTENNHRTVHAPQLEAVTPQQTRKDVQVNNTMAVNDSQIAEIPTINRAPSEVSPPKPEVPRPINETAVIPKPAEIPNPPVQPEIAHTDENPYRAQQLSESTIVSPRQPVQEDIHDNGPTPTYTENGIQPTKDTHEVPPDIIASGFMIPELSDKPRPTDEGIPTGVQGISQQEISPATPIGTGIAPSEVPSADNTEGGVIPVMQPETVAAVPLSPDMEPSIAFTVPESTNNETLADESVQVLEAPLHSVAEKLTIPTTPPEGNIVVPPVINAENEVTGTIEFSNPGTDPTTVEQTSFVMPEDTIQTDRPKIDLAAAGDQNTLADTEIEDLFQNETVFAADQALSFQETIAHGEEHDLEIIPEEQQIPEGQSYESEEVLSAVEPLTLAEETNNMPEQVKSSHASVSHAEAMTELHDDIQPETEVITESAPILVLPIEQTVTLFSYEDLKTDSGIGDSESEEAQRKEALPIFDLPFVPLESIDVAQLMQFDAVGFGEETPESGSEAEATIASEESQNEASDEETEEQTAQEIVTDISFPEPFPLILKAEQEVIDQIFKGIEEQEYEEKPIGVFVLPVTETTVASDTISDEQESQRSKEVIVFVWTESLFENLSFLAERINEGIESIEIEEGDIVGLFDHLFASNPEVADEELKNDTFGKYDDTVILLWYIIKIMALFGQAMLYIDPKSLVPETKYPSHSIESLPISDQEVHINT